MSSPPSVYPTGYTSSALPFYQELGDQDFEQFCADFLNLHPTILCLRNGRALGRRIVAAKRLLSGTSQKGIDIRADAEQGEVWFFQCKHTQSFGSAEVSHAIALAEQGFPQGDQFVLVTTCGLGEPALAELQKHPKWLWWDASRLTMEILKLRPREDAIRLVERIFGREKARSLFPCGDLPLLTWQEFFARDLSDKPTQFHHRWKFVSGSGVLAELESFAMKGAGRALILSAAGGQGKSRLLLELAQRLESKPGAPRVRFLNLNGGGLTEEQTDFLGREEGDLLLIIEDAHRLDAVVRDVARAAAKSKLVRLLVATRPQALEAVRSRLYQNGYAESLEKPLRLPHWRTEDIRTLAAQILDPQHRLQSDRLAGLADRCPLLVVLGGALINAGNWPEAMTGQEAFRERVFRSFREDFLSQQSETNRERLRRVLSLLSFVSPAPKNETLLHRTAEVLDCTPLEVDEDLTAFQAAGLIIENSEGIRLYPDLFADAVLLDACLDDKGQPSFLHHTILARLPMAEFPALMRNVAQADWEARTRKGAKSSLFDPIWQKFVRVFRDGKWPEEGTNLPERVVENYFNPAQKRGTDRTELLAQWASFAAFLPERTIELAELALSTFEAPALTLNEAGSGQTDARRSLCSSLPLLLKPIVIWHKGYAERALNILWSLDADDPSSIWQNSSNAIAVIAEAASFALEKPLRTSESVMDWLERELEKPAANKKLHQQPWILSALLKPFFGRVVEHGWSQGRTAHFASLPVDADRTRPLRQRALALVTEFLKSDDDILRHAAIPVIEEAIHPVGQRSGLTLSEADLETWRSDRLEVLKIINETIEANQPLLLLQLRQILLNRGKYDPDQIVRKECQRVLLQIPDTFELRVLRILTSWAHDEIATEAGTDSDAELEAAEKRWIAFGQSVAREAVEKFKTATELCEFIGDRVRALPALRLSGSGGSLLDHVAEISPAWCTALLEELTATQDATLDGFLTVVLRRAATHAPEAYQRAIDSLPRNGRSEQLRGLIDFLGWKHLHGGGLAESEREAILRLTKKPEDEIVCALARVAGLHFSNESEWAMEVLVRLKPGSERGAGAIIEALARLSKKFPGALDPKKVVQCLTSIDTFFLSRPQSHEQSVHELAKRFPQQVYEHVRILFFREETNPDRHRVLACAASLPFGKFDDPEYVNREIGSLWEKAVPLPAGSFSQRFRVNLIRALAWADGPSAPARLQALISECKTGQELRLATTIVAVPGSTFVFKFPDLVRLLLTRSEGFGSLEDVTRMLWSSACGGGRSYTNDQLDPEYRYILEQAEDLANRYRDDPHLGRFYRMTAEAERHRTESERRSSRDLEESEE